MYIIKKFFYWFYPTRPKFCHTPEGHKMRSVMAFQVLFHIVFALMSLTMIGFYSMMTHFVWSMWTYSCYLSLREMQLVVYLVSLLAGISAYFTVLFN